MPADAQGTGPGRSLAGSRERYARRSKRPNDPAGNIAPGDQLPSQREMRDLTGHSMETAGKAMTLLRKRELVETSTIGTFVKR
jgi:DNA-binding transcriptional MocR family regulator